MKPAAGSQLSLLLDAPLHPGKVVWIGVRNRRRAPVTVVERVTAVAGRGLAGDHYETRNDGARQVTLISTEDLAAVASFLARGAIDPSLTRRNLLTTGVNLLALKDRRFQIGDVVLEYAGTAHPCSRMEENLGAGGFNAMRGHGGILARIVTGGEIRIGDSIDILRA